MNKEEVISKKELSEILKSLNIPVNEGTCSKENAKKAVKIVYWPFMEQDVMASDEAYENLVTYQISLFADRPQSPEYKALRKLLREKGLHPAYNHEFIESDPLYARTWHTYLSIDVLEPIEE